MTFTPHWKWFSLQNYCTVARSYQTMGKRRVGGSRPSAQKKPPLTHFLCLPLVTPTSRPQLQASLKAFRKEVSPVTSEGTEKASGGDLADGEAVLPFVHPKSIRPVGSLHCTLGVMSLEKDKLPEAIQLLESFDVQSALNGSTSESTSQSKSGSVEGGNGSVSLANPISPPAVDRAGGPLQVDLKGLVSMHSPKQTSILYTAPTDETGRLTPFCIALQKSFKDKGFVIDDRPLKLHATVVNTIYAKGRKRPPRNNANRSSSANDEAKHQLGEASSSPPDDRSQGHGPNANAPLKIDATAILEKYEDFVWAKDVVLDRAAICEMGAKKVVDEEGNVKDEEYTEVASIALPT